MKIFKPEEQEIIPPRNGWMENTFYLVEVKLYGTNVTHRSIFYSGFINGFENRPGGYNCIMNPTYEDERYKINNIKYLKVIRRLTFANELSMGA
tara:strand:- start:302 stop:583 length:282 start_codon:yes stop_codon:yes gene_type:complete